jgi:serpin B
MNVNLKRSLLLPLAVFVSVLGCTSDSQPITPSNEINPVNIPANIASGTNEFAFDFFENLQKTQPAEENIFVSPLSLHMALGMLLNGAGTETAAEIRKGLKMEGVSDADLNQAYKSLIDGLPVADSQVKLGIANSVWYKKNFQVENSFLEVMKNAFDAEIAGIEFDEAGKDKINQWASDKTNGKIKKVLDKISEDQVMFLLNALYFKGDWKNKFDAAATADKTFKLESGSTKNVKMMYSKTDAGLKTSDQFTAVELPYGNDQFKMTLILPKGENTIGKVLSEINTENWAALSASQGPNVKVGLPRFTLDYAVDLIETIKAMGINKVFGGGDLLKLSKNPNLYVNLINQNTYLGIDEKGSEAAAVTTIGIGLTSAGPEPGVFVCDRPFGLVISEKTSNTILFMGRIMNPESK